MHPVVKRTLSVLAPPVAHVWLRLLRRTMRITYRNRALLEGVRRDHGHYILAFWHSRFLMMPYGHLGGPVTIMMSRHGDAEMLARMLRPFGFSFARGSSTRGGQAALRTMIRQVREGHDGAVAPDGPRGPRRRVKAGAIALARATGLPIVPAAWSAYPARRVGSWDRTLIPGLFSRARFGYGDPLWVPRDTAGEEFERLRLTLEDRLNRLTDGLDRDSGIGPEPPAEPEA